MSYTEPHLFLYSDSMYLETFGIYVMDDFGTAIKVPSVMFYGFHPSIIN